LDLRIDDGAFRPLELGSGEHVYPLANGLGSGEHEVELVKRVEHNHGQGVLQVRGVRVSLGAQLLPVLRSPRRLEFIGDSITCGYGNELSTSDPSNNHYTTRNSNARLSYAALAAKALDAEAVLVAASGRGVSRNWSGDPGMLIGEFHRRIFPDGVAGPWWDPARYQPHAVVLNAGTNDFSPGGVERAVFRNSYLALLEHVRQVYPQSKILVLLGPMLNDQFPPGESALTAIREDLARVLDERRRAGEKELEFLELPTQQSPFGEDWHPSLLTHRLMAQQVAAELGRWLAWPVTAAFDPK
jgi:lysophospholipase L1-like esterase